jgi:hypothetical protein
MQRRKGCKDSNYRARNEGGRTHTGARLCCKGDLASWEGRGEDDEFLALSM